jgi:hypothetical protein
MDVALPQRNMRAPWSHQDAHPEILSHCNGSESSVVDDQDIPLSYILYVIGVIAIIGFLLVGGFFLWVH